MTFACLEHINLNVANPDQLASMFCDLFDWKVRWSGPAKDDGYTVHVGSDRRYFALYTHPNIQNNASSGLTLGATNHVGLVVNDLRKAEQKVLAKGIKTQNHRDYGVCSSFYFMADETLEIEIVCYNP